MESLAIGHIVAPRGGSETGSRPGGPDARRPWAGAMGARLEGRAVRARRRDRDPGRAARPGQAREPERRSRRGRRRAPREAPGRRPGRRPARVRALAVRGGVPGASALGRRARRVGEASRLGGPRRLVPGPVRPRRCHPGRCGRVGRRKGGRPGHRARPGPSCRPLDRRSGGPRDHRSGSVQRLPRCHGPLQEETEAAQARATRRACLHDPRRGRPRCARRGLRPDRFLPRPSRLPVRPEGGRRAGRRAQRAPPAGLRLRPGHGPSPPG
jgi:hypothetical protein